MYRIRARYEKKGRVKYLGHLEMIKVFERAFRRSGVPLKYTEGFNPHPKMSFALPSSVGFSSIGEYMDVEVTESVEMHKLIDGMNETLPEGLRIITGGYVEPKAKSLMSIVDYSEFQIDFSIQNDLLGKLENLLSSESILVIKKTKSGKMLEKNLKDDIHGFEIIKAEGNAITLKVLLSAGSRGNLNPVFLLKGLGERLGEEIVSSEVNVMRLDIFASTDDGPLSFEKTISEVAAQ
jgi:radical SAM-linked protein